MLKPHGYVILSDPEQGKPVEYDTVQCAHCNGHFRVKKKEPEGGFCTACTQFICLPCESLGVCTNWIKQVELREEGNFAKLAEMKVLDQHLTKEQLASIKGLSFLNIRDALRRQGVE